MKPLQIQLEDRYRQLKEIRESLCSLDGEEISEEMIQNLNIEIHPLDIHTGVTSPSVTPYFLPRVSFPSCRDMKKGVPDSILGFGQSPELYQDCRPVRGQYFSSALTLTLDDYAVYSSRDIGDRLMSYKIALYGWAKERVLDDQEMPRRRFVDPSLRYRSDLSVYERNFSDYDLELSGDEFPGVMECVKEKEYQGVPNLSRYTLCPGTPSHSMRDFDFFAQANKGFITKEEVIAVVDEILVGMQALQAMPNGRSLSHFHHILPRMVRSFCSEGAFRVLYAYFDGRLKVQFTETLDFGIFAIEPSENYLNMIDLSKYYSMVDVMLKWAWPIIQGDTGIEKLKD